MTLPDGSRAADIVRVPFHGTEIHTVLVDKEPQVVIRPTIEGMGLSFAAQYRKLQTRSWATVAQTATVAEDGRIREMATVDLDTWAMLLANVNEERVADGLKPLIRFYQKESAKALRQFWTQGGAINPNADEAQLETLAEVIEQRKADRRAANALRDLNVINAMGEDQRTYKDSLTKHTWAIYKCEKPEIAPEDRLLMVQPYLLERGISKSDLGSIASVFGKRVKAAYVAEYGREPEEVLALLNGRERPVKGYYERDRHLFDAVFAQHYSQLAGPAQLELGAA